jgi:hypothetical protein
MPQRGDISARSALTIHRGTANRSNEPRPVLVVGVDAPDAPMPGITTCRLPAPMPHPAAARADHLTYRWWISLRTWCSIM